MMPGANLNASFAAHMPCAGNLALISQSGAIVTGMVEWAAQRAVGFTGIVSIGDQLDVEIAGLLDYFALDGKTRAILLYVEAIKDARKFMSAARAAARIKRLAGRLADKPDRDDLVLTDGDGRLDDPEFIVLDVGAGDSGGTDDGNPISTAWKMREI
jgi:succinyl-CoA synthetase alpha subunit